MNSQNINLSDIGQRIKKYRHAKAMTQLEVAQKLCIEVRNYAKIERGERKILDVLLILDISYILEVDIMELLTGEKSKAFQDMISDTLLSDATLSNQPISERIISVISELKTTINEIDQKQHQLQKDFNKILMEGT